MSLSLQPVAPRPSSADFVFDALAASILREEVLAGEALPSERELSSAFGVSRIIVRQAIHRLADHGLVRVRQGGATIVLEPNERADIRTIGLYYTLDVGEQSRQSIARDVIEKQFLQGLSLISIAERRASVDARRALSNLAQSFDEHTGDDAAFRTFERHFWRAAARAGKNQILKMEVAWWYEKLQDPPREPRTSSAPMAQRIEFYRTLGQLLVQGGRASAYYLEVVTPILEALFADEDGGALPCPDAQ